MSRKNILNFKLGTANKYPKLHPKAPGWTRNPRNYISMIILKDENQSQWISTLKKWNQMLAFPQNELTADTSSDSIFSTKVCRWRASLAYIVTCSRSPPPPELLPLFVSHPTTLLFHFTCNQILSLLNSAHLLSVLTSSWRRTLASHCFRLSVCLFFFFSLSVHGMSFSPSYLHECNYCYFCETFALYSASLPVEHFITVLIKAFTKWGEREAVSVLFIPSNWKSSICLHLFSLKDVTRDFTAICTESYNAGAKEGQNQLFMSSALNRAPIHSQWYSQH